MSDAWIDAWLGSPRFQKYVDSCEGDRARALALYEWNVTLAQALMRDIAHFEIALRNAYDTAIESRWLGSDHWLLDPESPAVTPIWRVKKDRSGLKRGSDVNYRNRRAVGSSLVEWPVELGMARVGIGGDQADCGQAPGRHGRRRRK